MKKTIFALLSLLFSACASNPVGMKLPGSNLNPQTALAPQVVPKVPPALAEVSIDYVALQRELGLDRSTRKLGYAEKSFNTCKVGYGYSGTQDCKQQVFIVIHFQLLCRHSEGTISDPLTSADMYPLSGRFIKWTLPEVGGDLHLDGDGFGQIKMVGKTSLKAQRLRLTADNEFLYIRAGEIDRIVAPQDWCN